MLVGTDAAIDFALKKPLRFKGNKIGTAIRRANRSRMK